MYIESAPGELGFPHHRMGPGGEGGWRHHMQSGGPGAEMQVQAQQAMPMHRHHHHRSMRGMGNADGVEIMGFGADAPAGAAPPMVMAPPTVMQPVSHHSETMMYAATAALGLGLAFVIWKVVKLMISGNTGNIQIMGGMPADNVEIMGFGTITSESLQGFGTITSRELQGFGADALPPGVVCPPGASYCTGPSQLSPADLARVQAENAAVQIKSAKSNTALDMTVAFGVVLLLAGGVAYALHKK